MRTAHLDVLSTAVLILLHAKFSCVAMLRPRRPGICNTIVPIEERTPTVFANAYNHAGAILTSCCSPVMMYRALYTLNLSQHKYHHVP